GGTEASHIVVSNESWFDHLSLSHLLPAVPHLTIHSELHLCFALCTPQEIVNAVWACVCCLALPLSIVPIFSFVISLIKQLNPQALARSKQEPLIALKSDLFLFD